MLPNSNLPTSPLADEPKPDAGETDELPLSDVAREALLRRLEAWIDEEERLIAEIERKIAPAPVDGARPWARGSNSSEPDDSSDRRAMAEPLAAA